MYTSWYRFMQQCPVYSSGFFAKIDSRESKVTSLSWKKNFWCLKPFFCKNPYINFWNNGTCLPKKVKILSKSIIKLFVWLFSSKLIRGSRKWLYCPGKTIFWCLRPFFEKIPTSIFEIIGHICLKTWKILSKIDYKNIFVWVFFVDTIYI